MSLSSSSFSLFRFGYIVQTNRGPYFTGVIKKTVIKIKRRISLIDFGTVQGLGGATSNLSLNLSKQVKPCNIFSFYLTLILHCSSNRATLSEGKWVAEDIYKSSSVLITTKQE